jgi:ribose transport system permease protein
VPDKLREELTEEPALEAADATQAQADLGASGPQAPGARRSRQLQVDRYGTIVFFVVFIAVMGILDGSDFLSWKNLSLVLANNAPQIILAAAVSLTLIAGQFDLSVGYLAGMSAVLTAELAQKGVNTGVTLLLVIGAGLLAGSINALLVTRAKVNAFIATLGMGGVYSGVTLWISHGTTVYGSIPAILTGAGTNSLGPIPLPIVFVLVVTAVLVAVIHGTVAGRLIYATGANPEAARLAGVRVQKVTIMAFMATALLATIAGVLLVSRLGSADPSTGTTLLLPAFAGAFLGASILSDGRFTAVGAIIAGALVVVSTNGLEVAGVNFAAEPIFNGIVLVVAVALTEGLRRRQRRGRTRVAQADG